MILATIPLVLGVLFLGIANYHWRHVSRFSRIFLVGPVEEDEKAERRERARMFLRWGLIAWAMWLAIAGAAAFLG